MYLAAKQTLFPQVPIEERWATTISDNLKQIEDNNPEITRLSFNHFPLSLIEMQRLSQAIKENTHVERVDLRDWVISDDKLTILSEGMRNNTSITTVIFDQCKGESEERIAIKINILKALQRNRKLKKAESQKPDVKLGI